MHHTVKRTARGEITAIESGCGDDRCPVEEVDDDDGTTTYRCPATGDVIVEEEPAPIPTPPEGRRPDSIADIAGSKRKRRR